MRVLAAVSLLLLCSAPAVRAQRGGFAGHAPAGGGFHGSMSGPGSSGFRLVPRSGSASPMRVPYGNNFGFRGAPRSFAAPSYGRLRSPFGSASGAYRFPPGQPRNIGVPRIFPRVRAPWFSPLYPFPGFYDYSFPNPFWGFEDDDFLYNGTGFFYAPTDTYAYSGGSSNPYAGQPYQDEAPQTAEDGVPLVYAPSAPSSQDRVIDQPSVPSQEDVVTLFFKDGRPPEQIRNYALTRSALLVTGGRMREIPLEQIDLVRTERVNRALGVEFRLPQAN